jgi:hypothetical protein
MKINANNVFFYPFSGLNSTDYKAVFDMFREMYSSESEVTIIMADTFRDFGAELDIRNYSNLLAKFMNEIGQANFQVLFVKNETIEHEVTPEKIALFKELSQDYGWSTDTRFELDYYTIRFKTQENESLEIELIFAKMDAFNCLEYLKGSVELNLVLKYPGENLNANGFDIFSKLIGKSLLLNKVYVFEENDMKVPESFAFLKTEDLFKRYQNSFYNAEIATRIKKANLALRYI